MPEISVILGTRLLVGSLKVLFGETPTLRGIAHGNHRDIVLNNTPPGIVTAAEMTCPRGTAEAIGRLLIPVHGMRDDLSSMATVTLIMDAG